uniref:IS66 family transposase n=1 Tax=Burkholderia cenocepacia TaxID=95486 RepID=UPI0035BC742C
MQFRYALLWLLSLANSIAMPSQVLSAKMRITGKYLYSMPVYRQGMLLRRCGVDISSNTLARSAVAGRSRRNRCLM